MTHLTTCGHPAVLACVTTRCPQTSIAPGAAADSPASLTRTPHAAQVEGAQYAHLCTNMSHMHHRRAGYPFGMLIDFAVDGAGYPIFCLSPLAIHSHNIHEDPRCSLVVQMPGWLGLSNARVTMFGDVFELPDELQARRCLYVTILCAMLAILPAHNHVREVSDVPIIMLFPILPLQARLRKTHLGCGSETFHARCIKRALRLHPSLS
jgi:Pyridoxamine 5'-phosphate oxidase